MMKLKLHTISMKGTFTMVCFVGKTWSLVITKVIYTKEVHSMGFTMVKVLLKRKMERSILVFSAMVESMGKEKSITQMVITTRVNGKMT